MITKQSLARSFFDLCKPNYNLNVKKNSTNTNILSFNSPERDTDSFFMF